MINRSLINNKQNSYYGVYTMNNMVYTMNDNVIHLSWCIYNE